MQFEPARSLVQIPEKLDFFAHFSQLSVHPVREGARGIQAHEWRAALRA